MDQSTTGLRPQGRRQQRDQSPLTKVTGPRNEIDPLFCLKQRAGSLLQGQGTCGDVSFAQSK